MESPTQRNDISRPEAADNRSPFVSDYRDFRESWYIAERDAYRVVDRSGESAQS
jgi:hypothetical protein